MSRTRRAAGSCCDGSRQLQVLLGGDSRSVLRSVVIGTRTPIPGWEIDAIGGGSGDSTFRHFRLANR